VAAGNAQGAAGIADAFFGRGDGARPRLAHGHAAAPDADRGRGRVGKTSVVRRLAAQLSAEDWTVFEASASQINAGMTFVGSLEERVRLLREGLAHPRTVWIVPTSTSCCGAGGTR